MTNDAVTPSICLFIAALDAIAGKFSLSPHAEEMRTADQGPPFADMPN